MAKMLSTIVAYLAVTSTVTAQSLNTAIVSGNPAVAPPTAISSKPYENPFTAYLTMTNSWGVVTGMPSVVTTQPSVITAQPTVATIAAGQESSVGVGSGAIIPTTILQSGESNIAPSMRTVVSGTASSNLAQMTDLPPSASSRSDHSSTARSSSAQQSTAGAAHIHRDGALLGAAAFALIAL